MASSSAAPLDLPRLWGRRGFWQIRLRWAVGPAMLVGLWLGVRLGFELPVVPILLIALASPLYNALLAWVFHRFGSRLDADPALDRTLVIVEIVADYLAMLLLLHYTGGASSPLAFFFVFHVIIGAVQFSSATAYLVAALAAAGLWGLHLAHVLDWLPSHGLIVRGEPLHLLDRPAYTLVFLLFLTATLFLTAAMASRIVAELRQRVEELARANQAIEQLMHDRTQFMLKVAHNLRAPLSAGLSMLELVHGGDLGAVSPAQAKHLKRIDDRLHALDRAIGQLLTIARARDVSREIPDVVVDLDLLAEHTRRTFEDEARQRRLRFTVEIEPELPGVDSGVDLLEEMMENLVSNAIKYTPAGGTVEVRFAAGDPGEVRITVRDTGIGIPEKEQGRLFEEFFRASNAKKLTPAGTGLGLALVKQTVERHHGRIHLASAEGQGTTVTVDIPVQRVSKPLTEEAPPPEVLLS